MSSNKDECVQVMKVGLHILKLWPRPLTNTIFVSERKPCIFKEVAENFSA